MPSFDSSAPPHPQAVSGEVALPITIASSAIRRPRPTTPPHYLEPLADPISAPARAKLTWISRISEDNFGEALWAGQKDKVSYKWCMANGPCVCCAQRREACTFVKTVRSTFLPCTRCRARRVHCSLSYDYAAYRLEQLFGIPSAWTRARIKEKWGLNYASGRVVSWKHISSHLGGPVFNHSALHVIEDDLDKEEDDIDMEKDEEEDNDEVDEQGVKPRQRSGKGIAKVPTIRSDRPAFRDLRGCSTFHVPRMRLFYPVAHIPPRRPHPLPQPPPSPIIASPSPSRAAPRCHSSAPLALSLLEVEPTYLVSRADAPFSPTIRMSSPPTPPEFYPVLPRSSPPMSPISASHPIDQTPDAQTDRLIENYSNLAARMVRQNDAYSVLKKKLAMAQSHHHDQCEQLASHCKDLEEQLALVQSRCKGLEELGGNLQGQVDTWKDIALWEQRHGRAVEAREYNMGNCVLSSTKLLEFIKSDYDEGHRALQSNLDHLHRSLWQAIQMGLDSPLIDCPTTDGIVFQVPSTDHPSSDILARKMLEEYNIRRRGRDADEVVDMNTRQAGPN
ncbi:hypothetical protein D9615_010489 [Tricholomella constricta]|uniref:Zn(2)-C6 fungal-type domain-containing protein n=1 Tax=Tricholomella constricta TaxID=117010 RepID=A0A8H5LSF9_9AGAR|nr:hypothetical protein D9615_010489 [Tricholomella constricta]